MWNMDWIEQIMRPVWQLMLLILMKYGGCSVHDGGSKRSRPTPKLFQEVLGDELDVGNLGEGNIKDNFGTRNRADGNVIV